jgi:hypothetical protein
MESRGAHKQQTTNRADVVIKNRKEKTCILIDVAISADRDVIQREAEKKLKYKSLCIANVEHEMCDYTGNSWSHRDSNEWFKGNFGSLTRKPTDLLKKTANLIRKVLQFET